MKHSALFCILYKAAIGLLILFGANTFGAELGGRLISGDFDAKQKVELTATAKLIRAKIDLLDSYLPNPKPSEDAWSTRVRQLADSPEFWQGQLKDLLSVIKNNLDCIVNEKVELSPKMLCWAVAGHDLSDRSTFNDSIMILKKYGRLPKDIDQKAELLPETSGLGYGYFYGLYARGITEYILIPYLAGKIK
jgi:hypothetical protein